MCGLFGFIGKAYNREQVSRLAVAAGRRGPHSCGWAWWKDGNQCVERNKGSAEKHLSHLPMHPDILVGHSRLATSGDYTGLVQPLITDYQTLAHNGIATFRWSVDLEPYQKRRKTDCDSELLAHIVSNYMHLPDGVEAAVGMLERGVPYAVLASDRYGLAAARRGLPLYVYEEDGDVQLCSVSFPGAKAMPEGEVWWWEKK